MHWAGILVVGLIVALAVFGTSDANKRGAELDALFACQKRIGMALGVKADAVGYTSPRAVTGGHQMLWPQHGARCEVRDGRIVELVVRGAQVKE